MSITRIEPNVNACPECGSNVKTDRGEAYCANCGLVVEDSLPNQKTEWVGDVRGKHEQMNMSGSSREPDTNTTHDKGLGSQISWKDKDIFGQGVASEKRKRLSRLRDWQKSWQFDSSDLRKRGGMGEVLRYINVMQLPRKTKEIAGQLFQQAHDAGLAPGRSMEAIADAAVYLSAKQLNHTREWETWVEQANCSEKLLKTTISKTQRELGIGYLAETPMDYAPQIIQELDLTDSDRHETNKLLKAVEENNIHVGRKPQGVVAACVYLGSTYTTQEQAANAAGVTPVTVRTALKAMGNIEATNGYEYYD